MKISEDLFCFFYMLLSSIGVLYQLGNWSILSVQCENSKTFCLKHVSYESSFRYTFTAKDLEFRCNTEGFSVWLCFLILLGVFYELVVYGGTVYIYYYKPKIIGVDLELIFQRCIYAAASITGIFITLFVLLPITSYIIPSGGERGVIAEMWASPLRGSVLLVLNMITAPLRWIFHNRFKTELGLDKVYTNYTCVKPIMENGLLKCPMELQTFPNMPELLNCEDDIFCTRDCVVVFPQIVINSLAFIFASLALFYRLLKLTHHVTERETGLDLIATDDRSYNNTVKNEELKNTQDISSLLDELSGSDMKDKSVARSTKPKAAGLKKGERDVYPRRNAVRKREETQENTLQPKTLSQRSDKAEPQQKIEPHIHKFNENKRVSAKRSDISNPEVNLDRATEKTATNLELLELKEVHLDRSNGTESASSKILDLEEANLDSFSEQIYLANGKSEERKSKFLSTNKKHRTGFTDETIHNKKTGKTLTNGANHSEHKMQSQTKNLQGKSTRTRISNGHLRKEAKLHRRTSEIAGNYNDNEEPELSSSEDIVEDIEALLVVEDESEFYMSGFRL